MTERANDEAITPEVMAPDDRRGPSGQPLPAASLSRRGAERFYDRLRSSVSGYLARKGGGLAGEFLLVVPDSFMLLWRLAQDPRVRPGHKLLLGTGVAYYLLPLDLLPEALLGPTGFLDDLVFAAYVVKKLLEEVEPALIREHWSGRGDVLKVVERILASADRLIKPSLINKIRRLVG